jgi:protoheme IX farnesyltransferase
MLLALSKVWAVLLATSSTAAGFILAAGAVNGVLFATIAGVFLLACGGAAVNQYQDRAVDGRMDRTKERPIPARSLAPGRALALGVLWIVLGLAVLYAASNSTAALLGLLAVVWYNGAYAWLKRKTSFAAIPGGLVGAIPPLIGWVAGGGYPLDRSILAVSFILFIWQVPHFWLLLLRSTDDYNRNGLPALTRIFSARQLSRVTFVWIAATVVACILLPLYGIIDSTVFIAGIGAAGVLLVWKAKDILIAGRAEAALGAVFKMINVYVLLVLWMLALQVFVR